ncbi:hypothetical protein [Deinococcus yunweiensis]|uniref:hypothetical protein n=1 Tax=Deinococcus yunweiensis TaxID=367282 RepID=UPI00398F7497
MRSITAYLAAAGITGDAIGPATTALQAALADAQSEISTAASAAQSARDDTQREIRENQQARSLAAAFRKVADKAGVDLSGLNDTGISAERRRELSDTFTQQVLDYVNGAAGDAQDAARILEGAGFDLDGYRKAGKDKRAELAKSFADSVTGDKTRLRGLERDAALGDLKLDPKKAGRVLGDIVLEKGKVTVKGEDGSPKDVETWGVKNADGTFTSAEKLITDAGWTMQELAPRDAGSGSVIPQSGAGQASGWLLNTGQDQASSGGGSGGPLDFLTPAAPKADASAKS